MGSQSQEASTEWFIFEDIFLAVFGMFFISRKTVYCFALFNVKFVKENEKVLLFKCHFPVNDEAYLYFATFICFRLKYI